MEEVFARHERVALQFSGGKDSLCVLFLLEKYWPRLTVYFCNSGNTMPETLELWKKVVSLVPHSVMVMGKQPKIVAQHGYPSDLVPYNSTTFGQNQANDTGFPMLCRYTCCSQSIMIPLHDRMTEDGITLIIRGQRNSDAQKSPVRSGDKLDGFEFLFPVESWTNADVFRYLKTIPLPLPRFYTLMEASPDCLDCTAWLEHGLGGYLKQYHPHEYAKHQLRLEAQLAEVSPAYDRLKLSIEVESPE